MPEMRNGKVLCFLPVELTCSYEYLKKIWGSSSEWLL